MAPLTTAVFDPSARSRHAHIIVSREPERPAAGTGYFVADSASAIGSFCQIRNRT